MQVQAVNVLTTGVGTWIGPEGKIAAYVRSTGFQEGDSRFVAEKLVTTLAAALDRCRSNRGDTIVVLREHRENVVDDTMLANLKPGILIIGEGDAIAGSTAGPRFTWTNTAGKWVIDEADVQIHNLQLFMTGANGIVKGIEVLSSGFRFEGNLLNFAVGATSKAAIAMEIGTGITSCAIENNLFVGSETHNATDVIKIVGATPPKSVRIRKNKGIGSVTAANGFVHVTVAALRLDISDNDFYNTHTASTACIKFDNVACDGICCRNMCATVNDGTASAQGVVVAGASVLVKCFQNFSSDEGGKSGVLAPAAVAT